jgi:hypothetical protein
VNNVGKIIVFKTATFTVHARMVHATPLDLIAVEISIFSEVPMPTNIEGYCPRTLLLE